MKAKIPKAALDYFRKVGREGGALGGKAAAAAMTPEERTARAKKAAAASAKVRAKKAGKLKGK
jgi:hypothetical protein